MRTAVTEESASTPTSGQAGEIRSLRLDARGPATVRADTSAERRELLERELDRAQSSLLAAHAAYGRQTIWLLLAQTMVLNAFVVALASGAAAQMPGGRALLAGIAVFGGASTGLVSLMLRSLREQLASLGRHRKLLEAGLQRDFGRPPLFATDAPLLRGLESFAAGALPALMAAGWVALTIYALTALPPHPAAGGGPQPAQAQAAGSTPAPPADVQS